MIAQDLINYSIPPLKPTDSIQRSIQWMEEFRVKELPVVENGVLQGYITESTIFDYHSDDGTVSSLPLVSAACKVVPWKHYYDVLKKIRDYNMEMIAVVSDEVFEGVILASDILNALSQTAIINSEGAIISFVTNLRDYSLSAISRTVELNGATILGVNIRPDATDPQLLRVVLRINNQNVEQIITGLNKNGYEVTSSFNTAGNEETERSKVGFLLKYLEM